MIFIFLLILPAHSKRFSTEITLSPSEPLVFLTKFVTSKGSFKLSAQMIDPNPQKINAIFFISTSIYASAKWHDSLSINTCSERERASGRIILSSLSYNGEPTSPISGSLSSPLSTDSWYFTISSCNVNESHRILIEFEVTGPEGSEFSAEDEGLHYLYTGMLLLYIYFLILNLFKVFSLLETHEELSLRLILLHCAIFTQFCGILFNTLHLWVYYSNGSGVLFFVLLHKALETISSIILSVLFLLISNGWGLLYKDLPSLETNLPIFVVALIGNFVAIVFDSFRETHDKHAVYGSVYLVGGVSKLAFWGWFLKMATWTKDARERTRSVMRQVVMVGTCYFWAQIGAIVASCLFRVDQQKWVVVAGMNFVQVLVFYYASHLFSKKSEFYQVSMMAQGVLPSHAQ